MAIARIALFLTLLATTVQRGHSTTIVDRLRRLQFGSVITPPPTSPPAPTAPAPAPPSNPTPSPPTNPAPVAPPPTPDADFERMSFAYEYKLYLVNPNEVVGVALQTVQDAVQESLQQLIVEEDVAVFLRFLTSAQTGECDAADFTSSEFSRYSRCLVAETVVNIDADPELDPSLITRAALAHIRDFVITYNQENVETSRIVFESPITVSATVLCTLEGARGVMNADDLSLFETSFSGGIAPLMVANDRPSFDFIEARAVVQQAGGGAPPDDAGRRGLLRQRQLQQDPYNRVEMVVRAECQGSTDCTDAALEQFLVEDQGPQFGDVLYPVVRNAARVTGSTYFEPVTRILIGEAQWTQDLPAPAAVGTDGTVDENKVPWIVWVMMAACLIVLLGACICAQVTPSRKQTKSLDDDDDESVERQPLEESPQDDDDDQPEFSTEEFGTDKNEAQQDQDAAVAAAAADKKKKKKKKKKRMAKVQEGDDEEEAAPYDVNV